jgi:hypothetical protein
MQSKTHEAGEKKKKKECWSGYERFVWYSTKIEEGSGADGDHGVMSREELSVSVQQESSTQQIKHERGRS